MYIHIYVEKTGLNRLKSKMRFHCKTLNQMLTIVFCDHAGVATRNNVPSTINFSIAQRETTMKRVKLSEGENTRKFTRDYEKSDGIILTRVTSWRPRLIASREILSPLGMRRSYARKIYYGRI